MKKIIINFVFVIAIAITFSSCKKDDNSNSNSNTNISSSKWQVSYFYDNTKEETYKFNGYEFEFKSDGMLVAYHSAGNTSGTWSLNSSSNKFIIYLSSVSPLDDLNDDWIILENSDNKIRLRDDNTTKVEELHFSKI